eukprot:scaffold293836_cov31-Tisochrysis_lutea.AAC.1
MSTSSASKRAACSSSSTPAALLAPRAARTSSSAPQSGSSSSSSRPHCPRIWQAGPRLLPGLLPFGRRGVRPASAFGQAMTASTSREAGRCYFCVP